MTKAATRRLPNDQRKRQPAPNKPAAKSAAKPKKKPAVTPKPSDRVMTVRSRRPSFRRAGLLFSSAEPTTVRETEIGKERFERIIDEPQLRCELTEK